MKVFQVVLWVLCGVLFILGIALLSLYLFGPTFNPAGNADVDSELPLQEIDLPDGFSITEFARVENARSIALGPQGTVFIGSRRAGIVSLIQDTNGDYLADTVTEIASGLNSPNGVAFRDGDLYVAEISRIIRFPDVLNNPENAEFEIVFDGYPDDLHHGWKFIAFGPDGLLYVPVGAPCNNCLEDDPYSSITRIDVSNPQQGYEVVARGVRNTVGFDWDSQGQLWFTDNGRDLLGENVPLDELNVLSQTGEHFGFPFCHQGDVQDPEFDSRSCAEFTSPVQNLGPHVAALGMRFYDAELFPEQYHNHVFIAEHGSWNREVPIGYRVTLVTVTDNQTSYEVFADGWLRDDETSWGRPVDVEVLWDGSLLVSDDRAGALYRISYAE